MYTFASYFDTLNASLYVGWDLFSLELLRYVFI